MSDKLGPYELNTIITGDARLLAEALPDESVDLIFTDPVYDRIEDYAWLAETAARVLKPDGWLVAFQYTGNLPATHRAMDTAGLFYEWQIIWHRNNEIKYRYSPTGKSTYVPAVIYSRGEGKRHGFGFDVLSLPVFSDSSNHRWSKPLEFICYYTEVFTRPHDLILDPFGGGGSTLAAAKILGRQYLGFEIDPTTADLARARVANTQPPLPLVMAQQGALAL